MKNIDKWVPTKFIIKDGVLRANPDHVNKTSLVMADLIAVGLDPVIKKYAKGDLLDLGCGSVPLYDAYKDKVNSITCADWQDSLRENIHIDIDQDLNQKLKFEDNKFDTIILSDVLEHLPYPLDLMKEINRVLKKDGVLIMSTPFSYWQHEQPYDYNRYTEFMYKKLAEDSNLDIIVIDKLGNQLESILDIFGKMVSRIENRYIRKICSIKFNLAMWAYNKGWLNIKIKNNQQPLAYLVVLKKVK